jgi:hypothetical protein
MRFASLFLLLVIAAPLAAQVPTVGNCTVLPADNIWNTPIDQLPLDANSAAYVTTIGASTSVHPDFGSGLYSGAPIGIPFVTVPGTQTKYPVTFQYADESDPGPYAVPLNAPIEGGSQSTGDRHAIAIDTDHCILYELYNATPQTASWTAGSGAIFNLLSDALRTATWTSADAAGLPIFPGLLRYDEIAAGVIRHAIRFTVPHTRNTYIWPARHEASSLTGTQYPPMGQRFRLHASFNISTFSPTNQIILKAMQKYGIIVADNGSAWYISGAPDSRWDNSDLHNLGQVHGSDFEAVDESALMVNPDSGQAKQTSVYVTVAPGSASVKINTIQQFSATVFNAADQSVSWSVNGVNGGSMTTGWITSSGQYTAPTAVPSPATVTVQATSLIAPTAIGTATVTIAAPLPVKVTISPKTASVATRQTHQFTATVQNSTNHSVTWKVNGVANGNSTIGTITTGGLYTAPAAVPSPSSVTVTAVSAADTSASASATVTITKRR